MNRLLLIMILTLTLPAYGHQWTVEDCSVAGNDASVAATMRDAGDSEMKVKELLLYVMRRPSPGSTYQDAEDLYVLLSVVDYAFTHHDNPSSIGQRVSTACIKGLDKS